MGVTVQKNPKSRVKGGVEKMATPKKVEIRADLLKQLETLGKYNAYSLDLVEDYMTLYDLKKRVKTDIRVKGLRYKSTNGNGIESEKPNESIINFTKINTQMLKILSDLGLKEPSSDPEGDGNDLL